jgi:hypothetical protein
MIEDVISDCVARLTMSSGDNLSGFIIDTEYALEEEEAFESVDLRQSEDPKSLVNVRIAVRKGVPDLQTISHALLGAWHRIAYSEFQAVSVVPYVEATVLRFVTAVPRSGLGVTGTFVAKAPDHGRLVSSFNEVFGNLVGSLPVLPAALRERDPV